MTKREFQAARRVFGLQIAASMACTFGIALAQCQLWARSHA